jgi:hypothetical protein
VLLSWSDEVQPTPESEPNYAFYDEIINNAPEGVELLIVLAHTPEWMKRAENWTGENPRATWVEKWAVPTVARYANNPRIVGWEIWNEPDQTTSTSDEALGLEAPERYLELLSRAAPAIPQLDPSKLIVIAATRSIQQDWSRPLDYNRELFRLGAQELVDVWNIHYYGEQFENVVRDNGVKEFLNSLSIPIWITESGKQGVNKQLEYVETTWPYLMDKIPGIERIYYYEFASAVPNSENFALRTADPAQLYSDLYVYLRDNQ